MRGTTIPFALTTLFCLTTSVACNLDGGDGTDGGAGEELGTESGDGDGDSGDGDGDSGDGDPGDGDGDGDSGDGDGDSGDGDGEPFPCPGQFVPTNQAELIPWLESGDYQAWEAESAVHPSTGPHFGGVRTFVDACLGGSLNTGDAERPPGSAAVKELYGDGDEVLGWAVMVKVNAGSGPDTWYWFEVYEATVYADDVGSNLCTGCHGGGDDFFLSPWPLQ